MVVLVLVVTYWTVMLVLGIGNTRDGVLVDVRGVQITTPSTTPPVVYQP